MKKINKINFAYFTVTGWPEHIQWLQHPENWLLQADQPECQVQQWQKSRLHPPWLAIWGSRSRSAADGRLVHPGLTALQVVEYKLSAIPSCTCDKAFWASGLLYILDDINHSLKK